MAKVVPMVTATSMFEEPSKGSKTMAYWRGRVVTQHQRLLVLLRRDDADALAQAQQWMSASLA